MIRAVQGSVCFVYDGERVLLLYRNHQPFMGKWDGLTGLVEFGESPEQTARREVFEESGLTITDCEQRGHLLLYNVENSSAISADLFVAIQYTGDLLGSEEGLPVWVPVTEISQVDLIGFVHITLPLVLTPQTFLSGTIHHRSGGEIVQYRLRHHRISGTQVLEHMPVIAQTGEEQPDTDPGV